MGVTTTVTYACEQCGSKVSVEGGPMGGGGYPANWLQINQQTGTILWFDKWECVNEYAASRVQ